MQRNNCYIDIHVLQAVPPNAMNTDDLREPKTAVYGGCTRARVSSQAWKKAQRDMFNEGIVEDERGIRTKSLASMLAGDIRVISPDVKDADKLAEELLKKAGFKIKDGENEALFFISRAQSKALAKLGTKKKVSEIAKDECLNVLKENPSIDIALFGRMAASVPELNTDACAQVAHAISTHSIEKEYDYFTAIDDLKKGDSTGAGHIATTEFDSSVLYRYAALNIRELKRYLNADTAKAAAMFIDTFIRSMPKGKMNSFANRTLPSYVYVSIRDDQPINMAEAFERPVSADSNGGYMDKSVKALIKYSDSIYSIYGEPNESFTVSTLDEISEKISLKELLDKIETYIKAYIENEQGNQ